MAKRSSQPPHQPKRRGSQVFRSRELLASLTLSAEAITIGDQQLQQQPSVQDDGGASLHQPRLGLARVSKLKVMARSLKERRMRRGATLSVTQESTGAEETHARDASSDRIAQAKLLTRQPIGSFETTDVKWSAVVAGDIEKFMYPSLRLEALYDTSGSSCGGDAGGTGESCRQSSSSNSSARHVRLAPHQRQQQHNSREDDAPVAMPSADAVAAVMTPNAKLDWTLEKRYQNPNQSAPPNGHTRLDDHEFKRLQFDQQLEMAECMLRKKEQVEVETRRELRGERCGGDDTLVLNEVTLEAERMRAASLYHPNLSHGPMLIPRLPQTRKCVITAVLCAGWCLPRSAPY